MKGDRKTPTRILTPRANQLDPTFLTIRSFSSLRINSLGFVPLDLEAHSSLQHNNDNNQMKFAKRSHCSTSSMPCANGTRGLYPNSFLAFSILKKIVVVWVANV